MPTSRYAPGSATREETFVEWAIRINFEAKPWPVRMWLTMQKDRPRFWFNFFGVMAGSLFLLALLNLVVAGTVMIWAAPYITDNLAKWCGTSVSLALLGFICMLVRWLIEDTFHVNR